MHVIEGTPGENRRSPPKIGRMKRESILQFITKSGFRDKEIIWYSPQHSNNKKVHQKENLLCSKEHNEFKMNEEKNRRVNLLFSLRTILYLLFLLVVVVIAPTRAVVPLYRVLKLLVRRQCKHFSLENSIVLAVNLKFQAKAKVEWWIDRSARNIFGMQMRRNIQRKVVFPEETSEKKKRRQIPQWQHSLFC